LDESEYTYRLPRWFIAAIVVFGTPFFSFVATAEIRTPGLRFTKQLLLRGRSTSLPNSRKLPERGVQSFEFPNNTRKMGYRTFL